MMGSKSDQFVSDLVQFYRNRGHHNTQPQQLVPRINGKVVDLSLLYNYVIENGGSFKVTQLNLWDDIYCRLFKTTTTGANISVALRQIYSRYLLAYEKVFNSNFTNDLLDEDEDESNYSFNTSHNYTHNHSFNTQTSTTSSLILQYTCASSLSANNITENRNPLNKLLCSLLSGLPNELDFAIKVSTILINSNRFDWCSDYKFINLLLECFKNYCCVCEQNDNLSIKKLDTNNIDDWCLQESSCNCYTKFWYQCCNNEQSLELVFGAPDPHIEELSDESYAKIKDRVQLVADIIRNLSYTYEVNPQDLVQQTSGPVATPVVLKFLLLLSSCSDQQFNTIALDILANISSTTAFIVDDNDYTTIQQLLHRRCVDLAMTSNNILWTSRCLEIVSRLLSSNVEEINTFLETTLRQYEVFTRITHLMTCQYDITLLLSILEFCLALSEQKPYMLLKDDNKNLIKILLTLLNCESSQHFTTSALKRMRIIDDRPKIQSGLATESTNSTNESTTSTNNNTNSQTNGLDNETFAMNWLKQTFEPNVNLNENQSLKAADIYAEYVKNCCRNSRRNVMSAQTFAQLIKRCFPSSSLTNNQTTVEGLVQKSTLTTPNKTIPASQMMSPILKAHLSAPPKHNSSPNNTNTNSNNNNTINTSIAMTTTSSSSLQSTTNTSTLIKSLLANKLRNNATNSTTTTSATTPTTTSNIITLQSISQTSSPAVTTTLSTSITPTKSAPNPLTIQTPPVRQPTILTTQNVTPIQTIFTTTTTPHTTSGTEISVINSNQSATQSASLPSALTFTPSLTYTTNNTLISTSNAHNSQTQQPQQFLLVRTIIASPSQQPGGTGFTATGTPVRLLLPASMLTQQRLNNPIINGMTTSAVSSITTSTGNTIVTANTSDVFLKSVLSNTNSTNSVPVRSNVKSSPLLNVLLDKGKLPESAVINNQINTNSNTATLMSTTQPPKMYILTTKSPIAIKNLPQLQTQTLNQNNIQSSVNVCTPIQTQTNTTLKACLQSPPIVNTATAIQTTLSPTLTINTSNHSTVNKPSIPKIATTMNGEVGPVVHAVNNVNIVTTVHNTTNTVNNLIVTVSNPSQVLTTTTTTPVSPQLKNISTNCVNSVNCLPSTDLSPIKDIKKAVDDATKLITKRRNDEIDGSGDDSNAANKKLKINSVISIPTTTTTVITNSIPNHDSNLSLESNLSDLSTTAINNCVTNTITQQLLTKSSPQILTINTMPSSAITTITANNAKSNSTINAVNNNCNTIKDNNNAIAIINNNAITTNSNVNNNTTTTTTTITEFQCQWGDCKKTFSRATEVFLHVHNHHIMTPSFPAIMNCIWGGPEGTGPGCLSKRPKFSLLTHLLDFHCNPNILQSDCVRKKQISSVGASNIVLPQPPAHPGYAQNAALLAIRRHATNYVEPPTLPPVTKLTPLTVSIRLTSALILRNMAINSNFVKRSLECFEQYLCELCMTDGRDESRTIAQCLAVITNKS